MASRAFPVSPISSRRTAMASIFLPASPRLRLPTAIFSRVWVMVFNGEFKLRVINRQTRMDRMIARTIVPKRIRLKVV